MRRLPTARVTFGPLAADSFAPTGDIAIIIRPAGAIHRPIASIDCPRP